MKNKEKYAKEIIDIACSGHAVSVSKVTGKPIACENNSCKNCVRHNFDLICCEEERLKEWAESEYIEKLVISKRDRAFLEYIDKKFDYIARMCYGDLRLFVVEPRKGKMIWTSGYLTAINVFCATYWNLLISIFQWLNGKIPNRGLSRT